MNPFLIDNYISPEFFCDRQKETKLLLENIYNRSNTSFFAQRRLGKTALVKHVFFLLKKKKQHCLYLDIYATQNLKDLSNALANIIYKSFPEKKGIGRLFLETIKLLRPVISIDGISGEPELSLDITQQKQFEKTIPQLLNFLDTQNKPVVIAIDEFQQILSYPEKNVEALLRSVIQQLKNLSFIFCGSNQEMMFEIFNSAKRPFYLSTKTLNLKKIDPLVYREFIEKLFTKNSYRISEEALEMILRQTACHTYYTQRLCHEIFNLHEKRIDRLQVFKALKKILAENEGIYFQFRNLITAAQWNLLMAIALEETVTMPYSQQFVQNYKLGSSSHVKRSLDALIQKEMVYHNTAVEKPYFELNDKFLMRWMQHKTGNAISTA